MKIFQVDVRHLLIYIFTTIIIKLKQYTNEFDANQTIIQLQNYFCRNFKQRPTKEDDDETDSQILAM